MNDQNRTIIRLLSINTILLLSICLVLIISVGRGMSGASGSSDSSPNLHPYEPEFENRTEINSELKESEVSESDFSSSKDSEIPDEKLDTEDVVTKAPNTIIDAVLADGGRLLLLRYEGVSGLGVYDTGSQRIVETLRLPNTNGFLYTAGGNTALIYYPENNLLETWDLRTFEKLSTKPNTLGSTITRLTMGHSNDDLALVRYAEGTSELAKASMYLLDLNTFEIVSDGDKDTRNDRYRNYVHHRSDGLLRIVSEWATSYSPSGVGVHKLSNNDWTSFHEHDSEGYLAVGDDGLIYTRSGLILDTALNQVGQLRGMRLIPGIGGSLYLGLASDGLMQVYPSGLTTPLGPIGRFPGVENQDQLNSMAVGWASTPYIFDRHIFFNPVDGFILFIPPENNRIVQRSFDLETTLNEANIDYLFVASVPELNVAIDEKWSYEVDVMSNHPNFEFVLEIAPDEMVLDDGKITWTVPSDYIGFTESIVLLIKNDNGDSIYHNFELQIAPAP